MTARRRVDLAIWDVGASLTAPLAAAMSRVRHERPAAALRITLGQIGEAELALGAFRRVTPAVRPSLRQALAGFNAACRPRELWIVGPAAASLENPMLLAATGVTAIETPGLVAPTLEGFTPAAFEQQAAATRCDPTAEGDVATDWAGRAAEAAESVGIGYALIAAVVSRKEVPRTHLPTRARSIGRWLGEMLAGAPAAGTSPTSRAAIAIRDAVRDGLGRI